MPRSVEDVQREIEAERDRLTAAVGSLRTDAVATVRSKAPVLAAGALGAGFVISGGLSGTLRLLFRRRGRPASGD